MNFKSRQIVNLTSFITSSVSKHSDPGDRVFNCVISDISIVLRETTFTISDSIQTGSSPVDSEIVRVDSLSTMDMTELIRFGKKKKNDYQGRIP